MKFQKLIKTLNKKRHALLAVLIDPDKFNPEVVKLASRCHVSCFLVGGSRLESGSMTQTLRAIKKLSNLPVVIFPGDETQLSKEAHGTLLPSLLSGRNADYLIGKQIMMAPLIRKLKLMHLPTAYLLIDGKTHSTTQQVTNTRPMPTADKTAILHTAMAAEQLGFKAVYLEAGSGAGSQVPPGIIRLVKKRLAIPLIVGGGIDSRRKAEAAIKAGADMVVIGNALEKNSHLLKEIGPCFNM